MTPEQMADEHGSEYLEPCELCKRNVLMHQCRVCMRNVCADCWAEDSGICTRCELDVEIYEAKRDQQRDERNSQ